MIWYMVWYGMGLGVILYCEESTANIVVSWCRIAALIDDDMGDMVRNRPHIPVNSIAIKKCQLRNVLATTINAMNVLMMRDATNG